MQSVAPTGSVVLLPTRSTRGEKGKKCINDDKGFGCFFLRFKILV